MKARAALALGIALVGLAAPRSAVGQTPPIASSAPAAAAPSAPRATGSPERTGGFVAAGLGLVGVGAGVYLAIDAASDAGTAATEPGLCGTAICTEAGLSLGAEVRSQRIVAAVFTGLGLAGLTTGALLIAFAPEPEPTTVSIAPVPLPGGAGLVVGGAF